MNDRTLDALLNNACLSMVNGNGKDEITIRFQWVELHRIYFEGVGNIKKMVMIDSCRSPHEPWTEWREVWHNDMPYATNQDLIDEADSVDDVRIIELKDVAALLVICVPNANGDYWWWDDAGGILYLEAVYSIHGELPR